ncbi:MAG: hypothetical protein ACYCYM_07245 [Saccharofermentanales bacterium]
MNIFRGIRDFRLLQRNMYRLSPERLEKLRQEELFRMVDHALADSSFYRDLYGIDRISSIDQFYRFPTISKQSMMDHFDTLNTCGIHKDEALEFALAQEFSKIYSGYFHDRYVIGLSSGTSGNKGIYITPRSLTERLPFVFLARGGIPLRYLPLRILFLLRVFSQGFEDINAPMVHLTYKNTMTPPGELIRTINESRINVIMAPPSMLRVLMEHADDIHVRIRIIVSYAEVLEKEEKARFCKAFRTEVSEIYQASEGPIGSTCRCGRLHINEDMVFVELYDAEGGPVTAPGVTAEKMIITNLVNDAQPLIRYEMNDVIVLGDKCPCGSSFRVIDKVLGRNDDILYLASRDWVITHVFPDLFTRWIITTDDRIREFKVIQHSPEELEIQIDLFQTDDSAGEEIIARLRERIASELEVFNIRCTLHIIQARIPLPEKKSKFRRFERR